MAGDSHGACPGIRTRPIPRKTGRSSGAAAASVCRESEQARCKAGMGKGDRQDDILRAHEGDDVSAPMRNKGRVQGLQALSGRGGLRKRRAFSLGYGKHEWRKEFSMMDTICMVILAITIGYVAFIFFEGNK